MRLSWWTIVALGLASVSAGSALALMFIKGAFAAPANYGWIYNYQTLIAGVIAIAGGAWTIWYLRKDIAQSKSIADREHALAQREHALSLRESYSKLMDRVDLLITRLHRWINRVHSGQQMMATNANVKEELLMEDPELNRLEAIKKFRTLRTRIAFDTTPWQRARQRVPVTDLQEQLLAVLNDIYRRLDRGQEIAEIARELDDHD